MKRAHQSIQMRMLQKAGAGAGLFIPRNKICLDNLMATKFYMGTMEVNKPVQWGNADKHKIW